MKLSERNKPYFLFLLLKHSLIYICFFVVFCQVQTDDNPINVGEDRPVEIGAAKLPAIEPYLAANPRNANYLPATVMLVSKMGDPRCLAEEDEVICAALVSFDAGKNRAWLFYSFECAKQILDAAIATHGRLENIRRADKIAINYRSVNHQLGQNSAFDARRPISFRTK